MMRKIILVSAIALTLLLAGLPEFTELLARSGLIPLARHVRGEYLTGTALTVLLALLLLAPGAKEGEVRPGACDVCDGAVAAGARYCPRCGSRVR